eukprot:gene42209-51544_t
MSESIPVIPLDDVYDFSYQVAGHVDEKVRRYGDKFVLKPCMKPDLFQRESNFYSQLSADDSLKQWVPEYHGLVYVPASSSGYSEQVGGQRLLPCMVLEDLTLGFNKPCVMDVKIGRQTFEPSASQPKKARELAKYPHQEALGFRITGFKVWDTREQQYRSLGKEFGRALQPEDVSRGLGLFFYDGWEFRREVLQSCAEQVEGVAKAVHSQRRHCFYCSSLLVVYDGDSSNQACRVRMIDFAHVVAQEAEPDEGYVYGARALHGHLSWLLQLSQAESGEKSLEDFVLYRKRVFGLEN